MQTLNLNHPKGAKVRDSERPSASPHWRAHAYTYGASNPRLRPVPPAGEHVDQGQG